MTRIWTKNRLHIDKVDLFNEHRTCTKLTWIDHTQNTFLCCYIHAGSWRCGRERLPVCHYIECVSNWSRITITKYETLYNLSNSSIDTQKDVWYIYLVCLIFLFFIFFFTYSDKVLSSSVLAHRLTLLEFSTEDIYYFIISLLNCHSMKIVYLWLISLKFSVVGLTPDLSCIGLFS
jgi:hypothetical protein